MPLFAVQESLHRHLMKNILFAGGIVFVGSVGAHFGIHARVQRNNALVTARAQARSQNALFFIVVANKRVATITPDTGDFVAIAFPVFAEGVRPFLHKFFGNGSTAPVSGPCLLIRPGTITRPIKHQFDIPFTEGLVEVFNKVACGTGFSGLIACNPVKGGIRRDHET